MSRVLLALVAVTCCVFPGALTHVGATRIAVAESGRTVHAPPSTVPAVNITAYLGRWFQVYTDPFNGLFEHDPYCATAEYGLLAPSGNISVLNREYRGAFNGPVNFVQGYAYQTDVAAAPGKLAVDFPGISPGPGEYWIIRLGPVKAGLYQYSVVTDSKRLSLFVLARDVESFQAVFQKEVLEFLAAQGFSGLFNSPAVVPQSKTLCDYNYNNTA